MHWPDYANDEFSQVAILQLSDLSQQNVLNRPLDLTLIPNRPIIRHPSSLTLKW
jgi:hypothetical protein